MPARLGYGLIYASLVSHVDEHGRLKIDALLGDAAAQKELDDRRKATVLAAGGKIG